MSMSPMGQDSSQLWMTVSDVFHISGRGTVLTGRIEGTGQLTAGDILACDGWRWPIASIERFRAMLTTAEPGMEIGVLLSGGAPPPPPPAPAAPVWRRTPPRAPPSRPPPPTPP